MSKRHSRAKKSVRRILFNTLRFYFILMCLIASPFLYLGHRADHLLRTQLAEYAQRGEPISAADLQRPTPPESENAAIDYIAAGAMVDPPNSKAATEASWVALDLPWTADESAKIKAVLAESGPILERVRAAEHKDQADWGVKLSGPLMRVLLPQLSGQRELAGRIAMASLQAHVNHEDGQALHYLRNMIHQSRAIDRMVGETVIHIVAQGCRRATCSKIIQIAQELSIDADIPHSATRDQVKDLIVELLNEKPLQIGLRDSLWYDRASLADTIDRLIAGRDGAAYSRIERTVEIPLNWLFARPQLLTESRVGAQFYTEESETAYQAIDLPMALANQHHLEELRSAGNPGLFHDLDYSLIYSHARWITEDFQTRTESRAAAIILSLKLYSLDHAGQFPTQLADLVPAYLPSIPIDPMATGGRPFKYIYDAVDPRAYSVGANGTDENGSDVLTLDPSKVEGRPGCWYREDAVFHFVRPARIPATTQPYFEEGTTARQVAPAVRRRAGRAPMAAPFGRRGRGYKSDAVPVAPPTAPTPTSPPPTP